MDPRHGRRSTRRWSATSRIARVARTIMASLSRGGVDRRRNAAGPTTAPTPAGFYNTEYFVPLRPHKDWPPWSTATAGGRWLYGQKRPRTKDELINAMNAELEAKLPGVGLELLAEHPRQRDGGDVRRQGRQSVKIFGPDLDKLEELAAKVKMACRRSGASRTSACSTSAASRTWSSASIRTSASAGASDRRRQQRRQQRPGRPALSSMVEGEKMFDIAVRWPKAGGATTRPRSSTSPSTSSTTGGPAARAPSMTPLPNGAGTGRCPR